MPCGVVYLLFWSLKTLQWWILVVLPGGCGPAEWCALSICKVGLSLISPRPWLSNFSTNVTIVGEFFMFSYLERLYKCISLSSISCVALAFLSWLLPHSTSSPLLSCFTPQLHPIWCLPSKHILWLSQIFLGFLMNPLNSCTICSKSAISPLWASVVNTTLLIVSLDRNNRCRRHWERTEPARRTDVFYVTHLRCLATRGNTPKPATVKHHYSKCL